MSVTTTHGENLVIQIQGSGAYGDAGPLTLADVWSIVDNMHTSEMDNTNRPDVLRMLEGWLNQLESMDEDLPL